MRGEPRRCGPDRCRRCPTLFCSSRGRHTRSDRDWSSDVCSSDLARLQKLASLLADLLVERVHQGRHIGAEVRPSVVPALPAQGRGVPAGHWDVFVAAQAKLPLLQALEKLWRSYRIRGCADMSSYLGTLSVLPPRLLLLPNTVLFLRA